MAIYLSDVWKYVSCVQSLKVWLIRCFVTERWLIWYLGLRDGSSDIWDRMRAHPIICDWMMAHLIFGTEWLLIRYLGLNEGSSDICDWMMALPIVVTEWWLFRYLGLSDGSSDIWDWMRAHPIFCDWTMAHPIFVTEWWLIRYLRLDSFLLSWTMLVFVLAAAPVSYTHLTLPTIYSV